MRTEGLPSGVAVARAIASGSFGSDSTSLREPVGEKLERVGVGHLCRLGLERGASQPIWKVEVCYGIGAVWTCING